ncbi:MAG TPA: ABC transporter substrate-binding protein [Chloroflexota bacterium]|nr:ABC transporter substrate-binding protein [Chloroflexota bacterium]
MSRRLFLRRAASMPLGLIVALPLLEACQPAAPPAPTALPKLAEAKPVEAAKQALPASGQAVATQTAPAAALAGAPKRGGRLRVSLVSDPTNLDPHTSTATTETYVQRQVYDPLVDLDANLNPVPLLAQAWEQPDPTTLIFKLRPGIKFHDGTELDAAAVKWHFERQLDPATKAFNRTLLESIKVVDAVDSTTVRLSLKEPDAALLLTIANSGAGRVVPKSAFDKFGADGLVRNPVGSGPFKFVEWVQGSHITLRRNDSYWQKDLPYLDEIVFRTVPDSGVKLTELRTGNSDFIDDFLVRDANTIKGDQAFEVSMVPGLGYLRIELNHGKPPFDNKPLRQAFAAAVNRSAIDRVVFLGSGAIAQGPIPPNSWAYDKELRGWGPPANPELAKQKLVEGGQSSGFKFTFDVNNATQRVQISQLVQEQLRQVGMEMEILILEPGPYGARRPSLEYVSRLATWSGRADPIGNMYSHFVTGGANNFGAYSNPEVDRQLEIARTSSVREERIRAFQAAQRLIVEDAPVVFLYHEPWIRAWSSKLKGYKALADGAVRLGGVWLES